MERYIGLDVHAASCTLAVISQASAKCLVEPGTLQPFFEDQMLLAWDHPGKRLKDFPVETNGQALVEAVPRKRFGGEHP